MNKLIFNYLPYNNQNQNELYLKMNKIINEDSSNNTLVVVESGMAQKHYFAYVNKSKLLVKNNIIAFEDFLDRIFLSNKKVLGDIKRFFLFYSCLKEDIKKKLNISNYFECIEIADDFFEFFSYIKNKDMLKFLNLSKWQEEKFEIFFEIKEEMDKFLDENLYIPSDWLYSLENLDLTYIKKYKKIVFYDIVDFPHNFLEIINSIQSVCEVEIILQMENKDFDMENLKLNKVSLPDKKIDVKLSKYTNDLELHTMIRNNKYDGYFSTDLNKEDRYSIFTKSNKFYLNDTKFYQVIETYLNLLNGIDYKNKKYIDIFLVKENIFKNAFMSFYGLDIEDYRCFEKIISSDYRYISLELLNEDYYSYYLEDNENLKIKLKLIFETLNDIEKIKDRALAATIEKNSFLGEYKERVLAALTFDEVNEKGIYNEIEKALGDKEAKKMIVSREVDFKCIKKYLDMAKSKHIPCKMMDNLLNTGEVCLVVASDDALNHPLENPIVESKIEKIREKNLPDIYYKAIGKKLCSFHSDIIEKEIPEYKDYYGKIEFLDSLFGTKCPVCQKLGGKKRG